MFLDPGERGGHIHIRGLGLKPRLQGHIPIIRSAKAQIEANGQNGNDENDRKRGDLDTPWPSLRRLHSRRRQQPPRRLGPGGLRVRLRHEATLNIALYISDFRLIEVGFDVQTRGGVALGRERPEKGQHRSARHGGEDNPYHEGLFRP